MKGNSSLISVGSHELKYSHLLIIGVLALSVTMSMLVRSQPADFGFELNEFDPFFNYRATQYMVENGIVEYYEWHDDQSWYPTGRDISRTSQVMLHLTAAATYQAFGGGSSLYDFTIIFPMVVGSLTAVVLFALVRVIGGTTAGLLAAMLYAVSLPILVRGTIGWFKSEPLGLFYGILGVYLLLSGLNTGNRTSAIARIAGGGVFTAFAMSAWGGNQFFIIPVGVFILALPFLRSDHKFLVWAVPVYTAVSFLASVGFERGLAPDSMEGLALIVPTVFLVSCIMLQSRSGRHKTRNGLLLLAAFVIVGAGMLAINSEIDIISNPSFRYLNAINPFMTTTDPLVDSVSEHATTTISQSFVFHSILMVFAGIGVWLILRHIGTEDSGPIKNDMLAFILILGMAGVYISSAFIRLEVFAGIGIIALASVGLAVLTREFFKKRADTDKPIGNAIRLSYAAGIIILLTVPMVYAGEQSQVFASTSLPPAILNGASYFPIATNDWLDALEWIKTSTPEDAVIASWWDYGYWISTMGERASVADNATLSTVVIAGIAEMFLSTPDQAWQALQDMGADYVLVFVAAQRLPSDGGEPLYTLNYGGDDSKKQWFMRIAGHDVSRYLHADGTSGTDYFWDETVLGKMFPFTPILYVNPNNPTQQAPVYVNGLIPIYAEEIKYPPDGDGPLRLAYASQSFVDKRDAAVIGIFIYEVNHEYGQNP